MFAFNKNHALPGSRQSSADSLVTDPSTSTSTSDVCVSQCSDASSYGDIPSPEHHTGGHASRRSSVFNLRSRSNTTTSTSSSFVSVPLPSMTEHDNPPYRPSQAQLAGQSFMDLNGGRRSLFRGKKGKRLSGSFSPSFGSHEVEEVDASKRASVLRKHKRPGIPSEISFQNLKHRISSPFDFQHLTHTDRNQFTGLQQSSENDLVAEFWAVRASQAPRRDLTGIKADDLHFCNFSSENLTNPESRSSSALGVRSPYMSPEPTQEQQLPSPVSEEPNRPLRVSRSVESFSRPGLNPRVHRHTQSATAPPRGSSRLPLAPIDDVPEESVETQEHTYSLTSRTNRQSGFWDKYAPLSPMSAETKLPTMDEESDYVGHALTTPDNSAIHPVTPPFSPGLADVEEEPERFVSPRPAPRPPIRSPKSPKSPGFEGYFGIQRSPIAKSHNRKSSLTSPKPAQRNSMTRPISQMSDTLGSPGLTRRTSVRRPSSIKRKSNTWRAMEESWEDDIDYIYDNALEADCDFDWDRTSEDGSWEDRDRTPEQDDHKSPSAAASHATQTSEEEQSLQTKFFPGAFRPSLLVPSANSVPELESRSAVSASTADTGVQTPSDFFSPLTSTHHFNEADGFSLTPSLLVPQDFKDQMAREDMYDDLLRDYEEVDHHFPLLESTRSIASSTRSSHLRSSKRSSYDSSLMSSGQGSGSWTSGVRRSASSSGSLPELVHSSRHARRDFNTVVDQLSEQVASITSFDEEEADDPEDDDTTPPGHTLRDRSFFASDDEQPRADNFVEAEVRASLELARRGSRSSRAPLFHHKYASSDGAAKLLSPSPRTASEAQSSKARNRAASSSNAHQRTREQYLSLFPSPPTSTPTSPLHNA